MKTRADQQRLIQEDKERREKKLAKDSPRYRLDCVAVSGCKVTAESVQAR